MMRKTIAPERFLLALLAGLLVFSAGSAAGSAEAQSETEWRHVVETEHYLIYTNMSRDLLEKAAEVAEQAYAGAAERMNIYDKNRHFIKNLERTFTEERKLVRSWDNGARQYQLPNDIVLHEWPDYGTTYQFVFPDGRKFTFWRNSMFGQEVKVYLCKDKEELEQSFHGAVPNPGRGGWSPHEGIIAIVMTYPEEYKNLDGLAHEISHQCMGYIVYTPPVWLDEGLAMYAGVGRDGKCKAPIVRKLEIKECVDAVNDGALVPIEKLIRLDYAGFHFTKRERLHYVESWALVHFLVHSEEPKIKGKFSEYLKELRKGRNSVKAFGEIYDLEFLSREWLKYIKTLGAQEPPANDEGSSGSIGPTRVAWGVTVDCFRARCYSTSVLSKMLYGSKTEIAPRSGRPM